MIKMAAVQMKSVLLLLVAFCACFDTFARCESTLYITYSPSYVDFQQDAGPIDVADIPYVISLAMGLSTEKELKWSGLSTGDLFRRPKANVLVTIETTDRASSLDFGVNNAKYPVHGKGDIHLGTFTENIASLYGDKPLVLEISNQAKGVNAPTHKFFDKVPVTLSEVLPFLHGPSSIVPGVQLGSLNLTNHADTALLGELQMLHELIRQLHENPSGVQDNFPDSYALSLSCLRVVQSKYGVDSSQARDAANLLSSFISQFTTEMARLYNGDVLVEVLTTQEDQFQFRHGRLLLQTTVPPSTDQPVISNRAPHYDANWPVIFNIILWMAVILILAVYAATYVMWNLDPGDTIIYRMTSQRLKLD